MYPVAETLVEEVLARLHQRQKGDAVLVLDRQACDKQQRMIDALTKSSLDVFSTMCGWQLLQTSVTHGSKVQIPRHDLSGIISISGSLKATIVVSLTKELAFGVTEKFVGTRPDEICADVVDLVGELTNMISGNAKERVAINGLILGLPTVVAAPGLLVAFESGLAVSQLVFESELGPLSVQLGIAQ